MPGIPGFERSFGDVQPQGRQQAPKKKKDFWTDQISTGTGIGGALGGAATGAAIGSVVPGLGTAIGGLIGGIAGGALGSGAGELGENFITGEEDKFKNVGQEALLGGVFSAPPVRLAKGLITGGRALAQGGGKEAAKLSLEEALTSPGVLGRAGSKLAGTADNLAIKQFRLTPSQLTNFQKKFGEDAGQTIRRYKFTNAEDISRKGIEPLQQRFDDAIKAIPGVTKESLKSTFDKKIGSLAKSASTDNRRMGSALKKEANSILERYGDVIDAQELTKIRREFDSLVNYSQSVANPARYGVNKRTADAIRETLQKADPTGNLKSVGLEINKLRQLADDVERQGNVGRGNLPLGITSLLGANTGGFAAGGPMGALGGVAAATAVNSNAGRRAALAGAEKLSSSANNLGRSVNSMSPKAMTTRLGTVGAVTGSLNQANQPSTLEDALANQLSLPNSLGASSAAATTTNPMMNSNMDSSYQNNGEMSSVPGLFSSPSGNSDSWSPNDPTAQNPSPYSRDNLLYDINRDPANADKYIAYYQSLQEVFAPQGSDFSQSSKNALASSDNAINTIDQLEGLFNNAGGGSGRLGGTIQGFAADAGFDENAKVYNSLSQASVTQIAKALAGSGSGTVSDMDAKVIIAALPTLRDTPQEARAKFAALRQRLENARNNTMLYGAGAGGGLEDALLQAQGGY